MKKPALLRAALCAMMPELARDPDRLAMWVEKGRVRSRLGSHGFAWEYDLTILISRYAGDPAVPFFVVTEWLRDQQPDILAPGGHNGFAFEVDILDDQTVDLQMVVPLDECVAATAVSAGNWRLDPLPAPAPFDPDPLELGGGPLLSIWAGGEQIAPPPAD